MLTILFGIFLILHGIVHLLYVAHAQKKIELSKGLTWPDHSWFFSKSLGECLNRRISSMLCLISAIGFIASGLLLFIDYEIWSTVMLTSCIYSTLVFILLWNAKVQQLADQGLIGILINIVSLMLVFVFHWPL